MQNQVATTNQEGQIAFPMPDASASHPPGLRVIFFTEMWERFSYYGMRSLLVLYLVNALGYQRGDALALYGIYTGLVYLTPIYGGAIADKYLGKRRALVIGAVLMVLGHFCMAFEPLLHLALGLLIIGNGFFKPNSTSLVGDLYSVDDPKRTGGYSIFYMGINLGAFLAPLIAGTLGETFGWHYGFACAGIGMTLGVTQLLAGQAKLGRAGLMEDQEPVGKKDIIPLLIWIVLSFIGVITVVYGWTLVKPLLDGLSSIQRIILELLVFSLTLLYLLRSSPPHAHLHDDEVPNTNLETVQKNLAMTKADWAKVIGIVIVMVFVIVFWTGFEQAGGTMSLFADQNTQREWFGMTIPASVFQAINPALIVLLAPVFSMLWLRLEKTKYAPNDVAKQALGMMVLGLGFIIMAKAQVLSDQFGKVGPHWLFMVFAVHTLGELMLSPVGLSMVSRVSPSKLSALLMGVWMLSSAIAGYLAGSLEALLKQTDFTLYPFLATISIGAGFILLLLSPYLNQLMQTTEKSP